MATLHKLNVEYIDELQARILIAGRIAETVDGSVPEVPHYVLEVTHPPNGGVACMAEYDSIEGGVKVRVIEDGVVRR